MSAWFSLLQATCLVRPQAHCSVASLDTLGNGCTETRNNLCWLVTCQEQDTIIFSAVRLTQFRGLFPKDGSYMSDTDYSGKVD